MRLQPYGFIDVNSRFIAGRPHKVQHAFRKSHLRSFRFDAIVQNRQQVGNRIIRTIWSRPVAEGLLCSLLLASLLDEIPHVLFQHADDVAGQPHDHRSSIGWRHYLEFDCFAASPTQRWERQCVIDSKLSGQYIGAGPSTMI